MHGAVTSVIGDTGTAQTGALTISGGSSGAAFDSTTQQSLKVLTLFLYL